MSKHLLYRKDLPNRALVRSFRLVLLQLIFCCISLIQPIPLVEAAGPLSVKTTSPRYFVDSTGNPVYLTGSYLNEYNMLSGSWDFASYLDFLQQQKQNFTRVWAWEQSPWSYNATGQVTFSTQPYERTGPGLALDGGLKFDLTRFNQVYFDQLRSRVVEAAQRGIYVSVSLFEGFSTQKKRGRVNPWLSDPFQQVNNINGINGDPDRSGSSQDFFSLAFPSMLALQEAFARKVVDTLNDLDNVLYEVNGSGLAGSLSWQYHMIDYIKRYQKKTANQYPVGISDFYAGSTAEVLNSSADWIVIQEANSNPPPATTKKVLVMEGTPPVSSSQVPSTSPIALVQLLPDTVVSSQSSSISSNVSSNGVTLLSSSATSSTLASTQSSSNQQSQVATPTITPNGGVYSTAVAVTLKTSTPGASIYYTTDGQSPTESSRLYTGKFKLSGSTLVKAKAFKSNFDPSSEASAWFANAASPAGASSGLVAYWKFDEGSGTAAFDSSGNGNTGTLVNGPLWSAGRVGNALFFDGIDDNVTILDSNSLDLSSSFTLSAWVDPVSTFTDFRSILVKNYKYYLYANVAGYCGSGNALGGFAEVTHKTVCQPSPLPINIWTHLAVTYNGSTLTLYRDGVAVATSTVSGTLSPTTGTLQIGASQYGEYFKGLIDEVRVYNRALTNTEIQTLYQQDSPVSVAAAQTVTAPVISPNGGNFSGSVSVTMQTTNSGAAIYYTTDGSTPTESSIQYTGAITLTSNATVKAKAFKNGSGSNASVEASASFTVTQPFNFTLANSGDKSVIAGSSITNSISTVLVSGNAQAVTLSASGLPTGATASFSSTSCSPACSSTLTINTSTSTPSGSTNIIVTASGSGVTKTTTFSLNVNLPTVATPSINPNGGNYSSSVPVTMQTATSGASIYYTTNGSTPTTSSTLYTGITTLTSSATLKAKAFKSGFNASGDASASFTVTQPFNFSVANSGNQSVVAGSSVTNSISTSLVSGSAQAVTFSASGLPAGATSSFSSTNCNPNCSSTLTINTTNSTPAGSSTITVTATGGGITKTTTFSLAVGLPTVATPAITPNGGNFTTSSIAVTMQTATSGASIYYTMDGSTPTQSSTSYTGTMTLTGNTTIKVKAFKSGYNASPEASASFTVASSGLVAHWKFDEGSGTTVADSSGNGNNGTLTNGPLWTAGRIGNALFFDGVDDNMTILDSNFLDLSSSFTLSAWVDPVSTFTDFRSILVKNYSYYLYASVAGYCGSGNPLGGFAEVTHKTVCQPSPLPINTWTHLAVTYNGSTLTLYRDGVAVATSTVSGTLSPTTGTLQIGASQYGEYFKGLIDEVRIHNKALSATEIQTIYQQDSAIPVQTVATPVISPNGGNYSSSVSVTMQTATSGASIYYTTNGSTPTQSSTPYTGTMTLANSATVKAKAFKNGYNASAEASASFTLTQPFNFTLINSGDKSVVAGSSVTNSISTTLVSGSTQGISFSASGLPLGAAGFFSSSSCNPACSTVLTVNTNGSTPAGNFPITITSTGGGVTKTTAFTLSVTLALTAAITPASGTGNTFYVATNGSDSKSGAIDQPFRTIKNGLAMLRPGDTLYIRSGAYNEVIDDRYQTVPSGTASQPITIAAYPGNCGQVTCETVTMNGSGENMIGVGGKQYLIFDGLVINASHAQYGVYPGSHTTFINMDICCATMGGGFSFAGHGMFIAASMTDVSVVNTKIHDNGKFLDHNGDGRAGHGIYMQGSNNLLDKVEVYNNGHIGIQIYCNVNGDSCAGGTSNNVVRNSSFHHNGAQVGSSSTGITVYSVLGAQPNQVYNNLVYNNSGRGISFTNPSGSGALVYNNTVYGNGTFGISLGIGSGHVLKNNISFNNALADGYDDGIGGTVTYSNNLCGRPSLWCTLVANPLFIDATSGNFDLQTGSPALGAGTSSIAPGVTYSVNGSGPDIGAY